MDWLIEWRTHVSSNAVAIGLVNACRLFDAKRNADILSIGRFKTTLKFKIKNDSTIKSLFLFYVLCIVIFYRRNRDSISEDILIIDIKLYIKCHFDKVLWLAFNYTVTITYMVSERI